MEHISKKDLLRQIQILDFYAVDLNLFLNTHPTDQQALRDLEYVLQQSNRLTDLYETKYGPLMGFQKSRVSGNTWDWISDPWPWENMKEGKYVDL